MRLRVCAVRRRRYECREAVEWFGRLDSAQYSTGWTLCQVAKAYFQMVDYPQVHC